jgi:D-alanyl-lipoteichoic acid acyltransferase DltB (MBOAT superfamily)
MWIGKALDTASIQFVLFGLAVAALSNFSRSSAWRSIVLLSSSIVVLIMLAPGPLTLVPLAAFVLLGYATLAYVARKRQSALVAGVATIVLAYIWLKKYTIFPRDSLLPFSYVTLGLSYMFFRVLHLVIDTAESTEAQLVPVSRYVLYLLNFTTLTSGPIQQYEDFARDQFSREAVELDARVVGLQLERIVRGFFKVNVLAMLLDLLRQDALQQLLQPAPVPTRIAAAAQLTIIYPFFLYANFSGYIDVVIALARLMRLRLPENFNRPFSATSFLDFWSRWHITLSSWLKTYVYNTLLGALMRRIPSSAIQPYLGVFGFFVTFFLVGIWHGRTSEFVAFGLLQGGGVAFNKLWQVSLSQRFGAKRYRALAKNPLYMAFGRGLTFTWFAFTLFWFWADWGELQRIFGALDALSWFAVWMGIWFAATAVLQVWEWLRSLLLSVRLGETPLLTSKYARVVYASTLGFVAFVITIVINQPAPDIIYKAF